MEACFGIHLDAQQLWFHQRIINKLAGQRKKERRQVKKQVREVGKQVNFLGPERHLNVISARIHAIIQGLAKDKEHDTSCGNVF